MPASPSRLVVACLVAGLAATGAGCASESDASGGGGDRSVGAYLAALPAYDGDDPVVVSYGDLARAAEIAGIERPADVSDDDAVVDYLMDIGGQRQDEGETARVAVLVPEAAQTASSAADQEAFVEDVGWSILELDAFGERYTQPRPIAVLDGDFDGGRLDDALDEAGEGLWVAGDPDGEMHVDDITPARPTGEALWLGLDDDRLTVGREEDDVTAAREADGGDDTLAGDEALSSMGAALDDRDVYSAMLVSDPGMSADLAGRVLGSDAAPDELAAELADLPRCDGAMTGVAVGVADDGEPLLVVAIAHADEASAEANVDTISEVLTDGQTLSSARPWSDVLAVESVEAEGTVVVATARPAGIILGQWRQLVMSRDLPPC